MKEGLPLKAEIMGGGLVMEAKIMGKGFTVEAGMRGKGLPFAFKSGMMIYRLALEAEMKDEGLGLAI